MKLITELNEQVSYLTEERNGKKFLYLEGIYLQGGVKNRNGRIYPPSLLERETSRYIKEKVSQGCAYGELGHPQGPGINMERISHIITEMRRDGNDYIGKARVIDEGYGKIARGIVEAEGKLGVSSRGMGTLKEDAKYGAMVVQDDFHLAVGADIVADPSAPSAWVNGVMEGVDWVKSETGAWEQRAIEEIRRDIHETPASMLPEAKMRAFQRWINEQVDANIVDSLSKAGGDPQAARSAVDKARIKARIAGQPENATYIWNSAKEFLGLGGR